MQKIIYSIFILMLFLSCQNSNNSINEIEYNSELGLISYENAIKDIDSLFKRLEIVHYNPYLHISKERLYNSIGLIKKKWRQKESITISEFLIETMKLLSRLEDGHTKIVWYSKEVLPKRDSMLFFPIQMKMNEKKELYLTDSTYPKYINDEVLSINGTNLNTLYKEALQCLPGAFEHKNELTANLFLPIYLYLKGFTPPYLIEFKSNDQIQIDNSQMVTFLDLYKRLQPSNLNYEYQLLKDENIGLINYNSCTDYEAFEMFLDSTFQIINREKVEELIVDIRNNSGGNSSLNDLLLAYITKKEYRQASKRLWKISDVSIDELISRDIINNYGEDFVNKFKLESDSTILTFENDELPKEPNEVDNYFSGDTYVLIGPKTFSSANMLADAISTYNICTLIGRSTGEWTNDFGEQKTETLPNSKIPFDFTIAFDIGANGDETNIRTVEPDITVSEDALKYTINLILKERKNKEANKVQNVDSR